MEFTVLSLKFEAPGFGMNRLKASKCKIGGKSSRNGLKFLDHANILWDTGNRSAWHRSLRRNPFIALVSWHLCHWLSNHKSADCPLPKLITFATLRNPDNLASSVQLQGF